MEEENDDEVSSEEVKGQKTVESAVVSDNKKEDKIDEADFMDESEDEDSDDGSTDDNAQNNYKAIEVTPKEDKKPSTKPK